MNTLILILKNDSLFDQLNFEEYLDSLEELFNQSQIFILNCTQINFITKNSKNVQMVNVTQLDSDLNVYSTIISILNSIAKQSNNYVIISEMNKVSFERNPFSYFDHFKNDLYFCNQGHIQNESSKTKDNYSNFVKTCSYFIGKEYDCISVGQQFFGGTYDSIKFLTLMLFLETNRNSANIINVQSVLTYMLPNISALYKVKLLDNLFYKIKLNQNLNNSDSIKPYIFIKPK
jgi:hypothetical protein